MDDKKLNTREYGLRSNKGSALMLVMICVAYIGVMAVVLLGVSYSNLKLKTLDGKSRINYYTAETAIAEIEGVIEEYSAEAIRRAYEAQLKTFIDSTSAQRTDDLKDFYFTTMQEKLRHTDPAKSGKYDSNKLKTFTTKSGVTVVDYSSDVTGKGDMIYNEAESQLTLKNIRVEYVENGIKSSVTTDIVIGLPESRTESIGYLDYALISDELIDINTNVSVHVKGGVYAGDKKNGNPSGIIVGSRTGSGDSSSLEIDGEGTDLVSRSDIQIYDKSSVTINDGALWVKNIVLGSTKDFKNTQAMGADLSITGDAEQIGPGITVNGKTFVKGDLYLNARYSNAVFTDTYYGYSFGGAEGAASNSAIAINGYGSSLDMSGINELFIAGRSFVSSEGVTGGSGSATAAADILEGESIATKKNETIYLVNSKFLVNDIASNPTSLSTLHSVVDSSLTPGSKAFTDQLIKRTPVTGSPGTYQYTGEFQMIYDNFLDQNNPIKCFHRQNPDVVYFYLNFADEIKAQEYVKYYFENVDNQKIFKSNLDVFLNHNNIKINASGARYTVVGAAIAEFNHAPGMISLKEGNTLYTNSQLMAESDKKNETYDSLQTYLKKYSGYDETRFNNGYVASILKVPNIHAVCQTSGGVYILDGPDDNKKIYLVDNDNPGDSPYIVDEETKNGIVIATGDIILHRRSAAKPFKGLIMAVGKIYTQGGTIEDYLEADSELLLSIFSHIGKTELDKYFNEYPGQVALTVDYTDSIDFENWVKDKDED